MKKIKIVICEKDRVYGYRLMTYLTTVYGDRLQIVYAADEKEAEKVAGEADILLLGEGMDRINLPGISDRIFLREEEGEEGIFKYQSAAALYRQLMRTYQTGNLRQIKNVPILTFCTPGRGQYQTEELQRLCTRLGREKRILLIHLIQCGGMPELIQGEDMAEAVYRIRQKQCTSGRILALIEKEGVYDRISAPVNSGIVTEFTAEDLEGLLAAIQECMEYQMIVVDAGILSEGVYRIMELSERIYSFEENRSRQAHLEYLMELGENLEKLKFLYTGEEVLWDESGETAEGD